MIFRLLDLFCGAGGAAMGYHRAGFEVVGVDIAPQKHYPFEFHQADALEYCIEHGHEFDAIHASPPCQLYSRVSGRSIKARGKHQYPNLIAPCRRVLQKHGHLWVMENVEGAPLRNAIILCGSAFGLDVRRHRLFEANVCLFSPGCLHQLQAPRFRTLDSRRKGRLASVIGVHGHLNYAGELELRKRAMGIDWMTNKELSQAIPPAYTEHIGKQLIAILERTHPCQPSDSTS